METKYDSCDWHLMLLNASLGMVSGVKIRFVHDPFSGMQLCDSFYDRTSETCHFMKSVFVPKVEEALFE